MKIATKSRPTVTATVAAPAPSMGVRACQHHWMLGQPISGHVPAVCRKCGVSRDYPAVLDDLDPPAEPDKALREPQGLAVASTAADVSTAAGGARPSTVTASRKSA